MMKSDQQDGPSRRGKMMPRLDDEKVLWNGSVWPAPCNDILAIPAEEAVMA